MTLLDALRASDTGEPEYLPIRRRGWAAGLRIWYSRSSVRWLVMQTDEYGADVRVLNLCETPCQMCLTPETILADDWELAQ